MEKNDVCTCTPAYWCHDENQMEPSHMCDYCGQQESNVHDVVSYITSVNKPSSIREDDDDERDDSEAYDDLPF